MRQDTKPTSKIHVRVTNRLTNISPRHTANFDNLINVNTKTISSTRPVQPSSSPLVDATPHANPCLSFFPAPTFANSDDFCLPRLLISNVRSLLPKIDELEIVCKENEADLVCITESWLHSGIPDSGVSLTKYLIFRNDRLTTIGGGVCIYVNSKIPCQRFIKYEDPGIESLWLSIRPFRLPRSISLILLAVIYHPTSCGAAENQALYNHIQTNVDTFLRNHPNGLVLVTGDFNPLSTGLDGKMIKRLAGLSQIIYVRTRGDAILDWCLTNVKKSFFEQVQLPHLERAIIIPSLFKHVFPGCRIKITIPFSKGILGRATYKDLASGLPLTIGPRSCVSKTAR